MANAHAGRSMDYGRILISSDAIQKRVGELAEQISHDYAGRHPLIITLLKGAFIFLADLVRQLTIPHEIDFITLSSYRNGSRRSPKVEIYNHLRSDITDRHVLIVDEIIETGHTIAELIQTLGADNARSLEICTLLDKPASREVTVPVHYVGFTIPRVFVVGYGLDFMEHFRNLPYIAELNPGIRKIGEVAGSAMISQLWGEEYRTGESPPVRTGEAAASGVTAENRFTDKPDS
jgi:hypoxanthine phosphoribosyltransferase